MAEKDKPEIQQARLRRLLEELRPGYTMAFKDEDSSFLEFRIDDEKGYPVGVLQGDYHSSVIADKSDEEVREVIEGVIRDKRRSGE